MTPEPSRPDEKPKINENTPMAYPMSVLLAELQRVKHKIIDLEAEQSKPVKTKSANGKEVLAGGSRAVHKALRERQDCIGALKAKVARIGEAIHMLSPCLRCRAMKARLASIIKGCKSVEELPDGTEHDDNCMERDLVLTGIHRIATGKDNWPEAMPYEIPGE